MDDKIKNELEENGILVEEGTARFMGNEALFLQFLKKFREDSNYQKLEQALLNEDVETAFAAAHTLKGVAGNLSLHKLYEAVGRMTESLRSGELQEALQVREEVQKQYMRVVESISLLE